MFFFYSCLHNDKEWKRTGEKYLYAFFFLTSTVEIQTQLDTFPFFAPGI